MLGVKLLDFINNLINSDIKNLSILYDLQAIRLQIEIQDLKMRESLYFSKSGLSRYGDSAGELPSIRIQGDLTSFLTLLISKDPKRATQQGLVFEGEAKALLSLQNLLLNLSIDWQAVLLSYVREVTWIDPKLSHFSLHTLKQGLALITQQVGEKQDALETLSITASDYIHDEKNWIPGSGEIEAFIQEVDKVRSAVERCEARVNALMRNAKFRKQGIV